MHEFRVMVTGAVGWDLHWTPCVFKLIQRVTGKAGRIGLGWTGVYGEIRLA